MNALKTQIMGILNVTPDSFYDQGRYNACTLAVDRGLELYQHGADLIDIGGESTRPYSDPVSEKEELERVIPVIKALKSQIPIPLSIDTMKVGVAKAALEAGVSYLNDVSGFCDPAMNSLASDYQVRICVMHMQGMPKTMQKDPFYPGGVVEEILAWFKQKIAHLTAAGIKKENIMIDPGIGFGKSIEDNYKILHNLQKFKGLGFPVLLGLSRKSFMGKVLNKPPEKLLAPTIALYALAMKENIDMIRVHDVEEHRSVATIMEKYLGECL